MTSSDARKQLFFALRRVLRPIVRILIRAGIRFDEFAELARGIYVESAVRDGIDDAGTPTRERITLATGLTRQQVDYYIENEGALPIAEQTLSHVITEVLHRWHTNPRYLGPYGIPLELEFDKPGGSCFTSLVGLVDARARPGRVLEALLKAGSVAHSGEAHIRAISRSYVVPDGESPYRMEDFGATLARFAHTLEHNFNPANQDSKRLERFVAADKGLPPEMVPPFEAHVLDRAENLLADLDSWIGRNSEIEPSDQTVRVRAGINLFLYIDSPVEEGPLSAVVQPSRRPGSNATRVSPRRN